MLTLILLVVLGGGVGILAVSMAERKPATNDRVSRRARPEPTVVEAAPVTPAPIPEPAPEPEVAPEPVPVPQRSSLDRRRVRGDVPATQTAVEGRLADLVRPSLPRRMMSLAGIAVIVVFVGVGIAALLGAIVGGAAEILGNAIG